MHKLREYIDMELDELEDKVKRGGKLSTSELEYGKDLAKFKMALLTNKAMEEEYSETYPYVYGRKRDAMGRYTREEAHEHFMAELHDLMNRAPDEHTKKKFERFIAEMK